MGELATEGATEDESFWLSFEDYWGEAEGDAGGDIGGGGGVGDFVDTGAVVFGDASRRGDIFPFDGFFAPRD